VKSVRASIYSVIETAKENGLHPFDCLEFVFRSAPNLDFHNDQDALDQLLPWNAPTQCRRADKATVKFPWDEG